MQSLVTLPPALTPWHMVLTADVVVQVVMAVLLLASLATWTVLIAKGVELFVARRRLTASLQVVRASAGVASLAMGAVGATTGILLEATREELLLSGDLPAEGVKDRIALRLRRLEHGMSRRMARGTGLLASIGSCGPFVGLFGTVWGIMNSFVGIAQTHTTNLAVVAPGIAEALLATACGLAAAIPAVLTYNVFARALAGYRASLADVSAALIAHASRDLDRQHAEKRSPVTVRPVLLRGATE
jgi:biopolymer transport protein ExbB